MVGSAWALEGGTHCTEREAAAAGERERATRGEPVKEGGSFFIYFFLSQQGRVTEGEREDRKRRRRRGRKRC